MLTGQLAAAVAASRAAWEGMLPTPVWCCSAMACREGVQQGAGCEQLMSSWFGKPRGRERRRGARQVGHTTRTAHQRIKH